MLEKAAHVSPIVAYNPTFIAETKHHSIVSFDLHDRYGFEAPAKRRRQLRIIYNRNDFRPHSVDVFSRLRENKFTSALLGEQLIGANAKLGHRELSSKPVCNTDHFRLSTRRRKHDNGAQDQLED
jgi:hypothetical protein